MKEFSKQYRIRECGYYTASLAMLSYEYLFSNNIQNAVLPPVIDYSQVSYVFPSDQIFTPEMRVTTKYKVI